MKGRWNQPTVARVMDEPCVLVVTRGQLCAMQGALLDAKEAFRDADARSYPLFEILAALARTEQVLSPLQGDTA